MASLFDSVPYTPPDAIFELTKTFNADPSPQKVNLGQGTYKDEDGRPWILPAVAAAKEKVRSANHEYLPILGLAEFRARAAELLFGGDADVIKQRRVSPLYFISMILTSRMGVVCLTSV
jgi:aspartate aminotransferase